MRYGGVDAKELLDWADTYEAGPELPRLVRKLILETSSGLVRLGFPAGKDLLYGGWDGTVNAATGSPYIPDGESLWELTTSKKVHRKANQDYQKRSLPPSVSNPSACTYVSVNLQKWPKKSDWVKERQQDGIWKDVRAYDVHDIETWLDQAPVSHAWISQQLGFEPYGIRAAESWWDAWSRATSPPCSESLVLAGRSNELKELLKRLASSEGITTIKGPSIEEVIAFVIASCLEGISNQPTWETKLAIIDDVRAWRILCEHRTALILIPHGASVTDEVHSAVRHHVIVPLAGGARADIELHRLDQQEVASVLREVAIDEKVADEYGRLARRSLMALRRRIAIKPELQQPPWAMPPISRTVRRCLLASRWSDSNQNDKEAVARIAGLAYEGFREDLLGFAKAEDPVVTRVGSTWSLISDYDAWLMLRGELQEDDIAPFKMVAVEVLKEKDPSLELPREDQMLAAVKGHVRDYSKDLRHGLAVSLALMATTGEDVRLPRGELLSDCSQSVVFELLKIANEDESCSHWASLQDVLTILCEAAPGIYLDSIRAGVTSDPPLLSGMFTDQDADMFSPSSPHSSLLWSLEILAWSPDYFGESVDLLARLEDIELGGRLANRPFESLGSIFCPWLPQTSVDADGRLSAIDGLRSRHGAISWRLMLDLLPHGQGEILMPTAEPEYREWKIEETASTRKEYWQFVEELVKRLLVDASHDHKCWIAIVEKYPYMIPPLKEKVIAGFSDYLTTCEPVGEPRVELWEALRNIIAMHEEYSGSDWSMSERDIEPLIIISKELAPENPSERWKWLFDEQFPKIPGKSRIDESQAEYEEALQEVRHNAICEIFEYSGWTGVLKFGENVQMAWGVGWALANLGIIEYEQQILELFESKESADSNMTMGYSVHRFRLEGWSWVCDLLEQDDLSPVIKANLLLATQEFPKAWKMADELGPEIAAELWRRFTPYGHGRSFEQAPYAAKRLRDVGRPFSALQLISIYMRKENDQSQGELLAEILESFLTEKDLGTEGISQLLRHDILAAFKYLQGLEDFDLERLVRLEWAYMRVLRYDGSPATLHRLMAENPAFFVDVISSVYHPKHRDDDTGPTDETKRIAENAFQLLTTWRTMPGISPDHTVDVGMLRNWIDRTRKVLSEVDRLEIGETHIGHVLAACPTDSDGRFPCQEVRDLLEDLQSEDVEQGFCIELRNQRGVTSRSLGDGGEQERTLAAKYRDQAKQYSDMWPRTAAVFRRLAESYEREARGHDEDAERYQSGLDA